MTKNNHIIISGTVVHPNFFRLRLIPAFSIAWFTQNIILTEHNSQISAVQYSQQFGTIFHYISSARIPNSSFFIEVVAMVKTVCWYLLYSSRNREANIGDHLEKGSNFEQRERKYANTLGVGGHARGQKSLQKHFYSIWFVYITICFHSTFTFMRF